MDFILTGGQTYDAKVAVELLKKVDITGSHILADKAYGAASIREYITEHGGEYTIPPRKNIKEPWEYDRERYKHRHVIECFFQPMEMRRYYGIRTSDCSKRTLFY